MATLEDKSLNIIWIIWIIWANVLVLPFRFGVSWFLRSKVKYCGHISRTSLIYFFRNNYYVVVRACINLLKEIKIKDWQKITCHLLLRQSHLIVTIFILLFINFKFKNKFLTLHFIIIIAFKFIIYVNISKNIFIVQNCFLYFYIKHLFLRQLEKWSRHSRHYICKRVSRTVRELLQQR